MTLTAKARKYLFHLRQLRKKVSQKVLLSFYSAAVQSILTGRLTARYRNSSSQDRVVPLQNCAISWAEVAEVQRQRLEDRNPSNGLFLWLWSGKRLCSHKSHTERLRKSNNELFKDIKPNNQTFTYTFYISCTYVVYFLRVWWNITSIHTCMYVYYKSNLLNLESLCVKVRWKWKFTLLCHPFHLCQQSIHAQRLMWHWSFFFVFTESSSNSMFNDHSYRALHDQAPAYIRECS